MITLTSPLTRDKIKKLKVGDRVLLTGFIYTARDQAHKRLLQLINKKSKLPLSLKDKLIYYCGPTATAPGEIIGSCGPTTSSRMDKFVEPLLKEGLLGMIGKGRRSREVISLIKRYKAIYFIAPSGCGAYLARCVLNKKLVGFGDLGPEAIYELEVKDFPLVVGIDSQGRNIYKKLS